MVSLNKSFHLVVHEDSASRSDCSWMQSCGEQIGRRHLVSSAKRSDSECFNEGGKSFMYTRNKRGPSKLPWGTPEITGSRGVARISTRWFL